MIQKSKDRSPQSLQPPRPRGRPRGFEPETALARAMDAFWREGYAATSLDAIAAATGLNRPSLYGAFGDKHALYVQAYRRYREQVRESFAPLLAEPAPIRDKLRRILGAALELYLAGEDGPRGCFTVLTASSDAAADPAIQAMAAEAIRGTDRAFERLFAAAREAGELPPEADPRRLARLTAAVLHTLSIRARVGIPRSEIEPIVADATETICATALPV